MIRVTEFFTSVQGESSWVGKPCTFVRLTGCPLRCRWCDTAYAFHNGEDYSIDQIVEEVRRRKVSLVEITGGEPLAQPETPSLMARLIEDKFDVMLETSGSEPLDQVPKQVKIIMDLKCPDSQMAHRNRYENLELLKPSDEVKFVVASRDDFDWAVSTAQKWALNRRCEVLFSPAWGHVNPRDLVGWLLAADEPGRLNLQIHKYIWGPRVKGV